MKFFLGLLLFFTVTSQTVFGTHILGGEVTYKYLGSDGPANRPFRYLIHFVGYVDRLGTPGQLSNWGCGNLETNPQLAIYDAATNTRIPRSAQFANYPLPSHGPQIQGTCPINPYYGGVRPLVIPVPAACVVPGLSELNVAITDTTFEVQLPFSAGGYYVKYNNCCRTENTTNIFFPGGNNNPGNTWLAYIPSPVFVNSSPQFIGDAVPFFCLGDTAVISNNAFDPDGDRLIYSFANPYSGSFNSIPTATYTAPSNATFQSGFSAEQPFGPGGYAFINPSTGLTKYYSPSQGNFAVAIDIQEYRTLSNGTEILLSTTRREFLVVVKPCAPNPAPTPIIGGTSQGTTFIRTEGDSVVFTIKSFDVDTTTISAESELLVPGNNTGSLAVCPTVTGTDTVKTTFRWKIDCGVTKGIVRNYSVTVKYQDKGCPPKTNNVVYTIIVNPFKAPTITGRDTICATDANVSYSVPAGTGRQWRIEGGNISGSSTGNSVNVNLSSDTARLWMVVTSGQGCKDSTFKRIVRAPFVPIVASSSKLFVCQDSTVSLSAVGGYSTVSWSPGTGLSASNIRNPMANPTDSISYVVTSNGPGGCVARDTVELKWIPRVANAGPDSILCSGSSRIIGQSQATGYAFYHYQWSPALGLTSDTSFVTTAQITNGSSAPVIQTYVQRATHRASGCTATDTVRLTIKPLPVVNAGPDSISFCSGGSVVLGVADPSLATFNWTPSLGLTNPGKDTTRLTLNPDSQSVQYYKYYVQKTEQFLIPNPGEPACSNIDSIVVKVLPLPFFELATNDSICSGFQTTIGTTAQSGFSYSWAPNTGLSNPTGAQTNFTGVHTGPLPVDSIFTLTVTNNATACSRPKSITLRINPLPSVSAGLDSAICSGDSIHIGELSETGFSYSWSPVTGINNPGIGNPSVGLVNPVVAGPNISTEFKLIKTNIRTNCRNADSVIIQVKALPTVFAAAQDTLAVCSQSTLNLGGDPLANHSYSWQPDTALSNPSSSNPTLSINNPSQSIGFFTYVLQATNQLSTCKNRDTVTVLVNPLPIVPLSYSDTSVCSKQTIAVGGTGSAGFSYNWSPKGPLADSTTALTNFTAINSTPNPVTYSFTLEATNNSTSCKSSKPLTVKVNPIPAADAGEDKEVCSLDSIQIGSAPVAGRSYLWTPSTGLSNPNIANPKVALENTGNTNLQFTYTVQVRDLNFTTQCDSSDSMVLTVKPLPTAIAASFDSIAVCATTSLQLGITGQADLDYLWTPSQNLSSAVVSNPTFSLATSTGSAYLTYRLLVTNPATTCKKADSVAILVHALPEVVTGTLDSLCSGDTIQIGPGTLPVPNILYSWSAPNGIVSPGNGFNPLVSLVQTGSIPVVVPFNLVVRNIQTGCKDSTTFPIRVNPLPPANAGTDKTICSGSSIGVGAPGSFGFSYQWGNNTGLNFSNISDPIFSSVTGSSPKKDTLIVLMTNTQTTCFKSDTTIVTTNPRPEPVQFGLFSPTVCPFISNVAYSVTNTLPGNTYEWAISGGLQSTGANTNAITVNWGATNPNATIKVTPTNSYGCIGTPDSIAININQTLKPVKPFGDSVLCSYVRANRVYATIPTVGSNYTWKFLNGDIDSLVTGNPFASVSWNITDGLGKVWIQEQSNTIDPTTNTPVQCFGKSDTLYVRINPSPDSTLAITGTTNVCVGAGTQSVYALAGMQGSTFNWEVDPATTIVSGQGTNTLTLGWPQTGTYVLRVVETSEKGCVGRPISSTINSNPRPTPGLGNAPNLAICPNDLQKTYTAAPSPGISGSGFVWAITGGTATGNTNESTVQITWNPAGPYSLNLKEISPQGCEADTNLSLVVDASSIQLEEVSLLENDENQVSVKFVLNQPENNPNSLSIWRKPLGSADNAFALIQQNIAKNITQYIDQPGSTGNTAYQYKIVSQNLCEKAIESQVHNTVLLDVKAMEKESAAHLTWNPYQNWSAPTRYRILRKVDSEASLKELENNIPQSNSPSRHLEVGTDGFNQCFRVLAESGDFSSWSNTVCVKFENALEFFNLFTPNGDSKNDEWEIKNLHLYPKNKLNIYDRWGKEVYSAENYSNDNLWKGDKVQEGVYFYRFSVPDKSLEYNGWITIKK